MPNMVKIKAEEKEKIFQNNPFDSRLDTHNIYK